MRGGRGWCHIEGRPSCDGTSPFVIKPAIHRDHGDILETVSAQRLAGILSLMHAACKLPQ